MKRIKKTLREQITLDGLMTVGQLETGTRTLDFQCCEDVEAEPFKGQFRVQGMRDGNIYMVEKPRKQRRHPLFRDDNCSLSLGRNHRFYFVFTLDQGLVEELPQELVRQAGAIAQKVLRELIINQ